MDRDQLEDFIESNLTPQNLFLSTMGIFLNWCKSGQEALLADPYLSP